MSAGISFTHVLNPFPARAGSEHAIASRITWQSLRVAHQQAVEQGIEVNCRAAILRGDEAAVESPVSQTLYLPRSVQDVATLLPRRPLPLIGDILNVGSQDVTTSHLIFSNMDIALRPGFYVSLRDMIAGSIGQLTPFTVPRINIDPSLADASLATMYAAPGSLGRGYDCFVLPIGLVPLLDLGTCCIGAPHFDNLLVMELDVLAPGGVKASGVEPLTFHLGNDFAWAAMIDYVEHNLSECMQAIARMRQRYAIPDGSLFDRVDRRHFRRNASFASALFRRVKRVPGLSRLILKTKRAIGREF